MLTLYIHSCGGNTRKYYLYHPGADDTENPLEAKRYYQLTSEQARALKHNTTMPDLRNVEPVALSRCECPQSSCLVIPVTGYNPSSPHPNNAEKAKESVTTDAQGSAREVATGHKSKKASAADRGVKGYREKHATA